MRVFDIIDNKVIMDPQSLSVPEFKFLWDRDKSKMKATAIKEISYVVFLCDESVDNPYRFYKDEDRDRVLRKDFMSEGWEPDEEVLKAIEKLREMRQTTNTRLLRSAKKAAERLSEYFDAVDFSKKDSSGRLLYSSRDVSANLKEVAGIIKSLNMLEEMVRKEMSESSNIRGGGDIGMYEVAREDFDYGIGE